MTPDIKIAIELLNLSPAKLAKVAKWLGVHERDYCAGESALQYVCLILLRAEQTDRLLKMGEEIDRLNGRSHLTTDKRRAIKPHAIRLQNPQGESRSPNH